MAACGFGASTVKVSNLGSVSSKLGTLHPLHVPRIRAPIRYNKLVISWNSKKASIGCHSMPSKDQNAPNSENESEDVKSSNTLSQLIPNSYEVESLLTQICDTSIAEFELKLGGFRLYVTRDLTRKNIPSPHPVSPPVNVNTPVETPELNGSISTPSLAVSKRGPSGGGIQTYLDEATNEGLVVIRSAQVGYFRRCRTIKGRRAPPSCKEKQVVKEGQALCYIEQLGGEIPVESGVAGEVIKILREDGDPVGYGDALIAILPSFPGIKKLQ